MPPLPMNLYLTLPTPVLLVDVITSKGSCKGDIVACKGELCGCELASGFNLHYFHSNFVFQNLNNSAGGIISPWGSCCGVGRFCKICTSSAS